MNQRQIHQPQAKAEHIKPVFRIKSRFITPVFLYENPIRLVVAFLIVFFMLPEAQWVINFLTGTTGVLNLLIVVSIVLVATIGAPFLVTYLMYKEFTYDFYDDHLEFYDGYFLRDRVKISYRNIIKVEKKANWVERYYNVADLCLVAEQRIGRLKMKPQGHMILDIPNPDQVKTAIENLLRTYKEERPQNNKKT